MRRDYSFCSYLPKETVENWYTFFFKCLVEHILVWYFLFWKVINCWLSSFNRYRCLYISVFTCGKLCLSRNLSVHFTYIIKFMSIEFFIVFLYFSFMYMESVVMLLFYCDISNLRTLYFLIILARGLSIFFSRKISLNFNNYISIYLCT